jgi:hypothetical protein
LRRSCVPKPAIVASNCALGVDSSRRAALTVQGRRGIGAWSGSDADQGGAAFRVAVPDGPHAALRVPAGASSRPRARLPSVRCRPGGSRAAVLLVTAPSVAVPPSSATLNAGSPAVRSSPAVPSSAIPAGGLVRPPPGCLLRRWRHGRWRRRPPRSRPHRSRVPRPCCVPHQASFEQPCPTDRTVSTGADIDRAYGDWPGRGHARSRSPPRRDPHGPKRSRGNVKPDIPARVANPFARKPGTEDGDIQRLDTWGRPPGRP